MPELPEVETVRRSLVTNVKGSAFIDITVRRSKLIKNFDPSVLIGLRIIEVRRHGKYLLFDLSNGKVLLSHLRMEGKYSFHEGDFVPGKHDHVIFKMDNGKLMIYSDVRVFGTFHLYDAGNYMNSKEIQAVHIDPLQPGFTGKYVRDRLLKKKIAVKTALLDQKIGAGIGNIYADEILWACKVHPQLPANKISVKQANDIAKNARRILEKAVSMNGTTIRTYRSTAGAGMFVNELQAHSRVGLPCSRCKNKIVKIKVNGRGTYFCPVCQNRA